MKERLYKGLIAVIGILILTLIGMMIVYLPLCLLAWEWLPIDHPSIRIVMFTLVMFWIVMAIFSEEKI